ncbi:MAG: hypothetical protein RLZZ546_1742, partial [Bacteroidota bacterium]
LPALLDTPEAWNSIDIKSTQPRTYFIWTKLNEYYITFSKTFYCKERDITVKNYSEDLIVHFLDGFWEIVVDNKKTAESNNNFSLINKQDEFVKKTFLIGKNINFHYRSNKQKDWIYTITLSKSEPYFTGNPLKQEIKESLLKSAKILIY